MMFTLTDRDHELNSALCQKVRLFSLQQIAMTWWNGETANARRRLRQLAHAGLIQRIEVAARTLPSLTQPVVVWRPGMEPPDCDAASYKLQRRWQSLPVRPCTAFIASESAARLYGARNRGDLRHPLQATHDLGVAQVFLQLRATARPWAEAWRGEDFLAETRRGEKCPDAFIVNDENQIVCVIEFGGQYHAERIREFHDDCCHRNLLYQLW
jgi:hypothetical protein